MSTSTSSLPRRASSRRHSTAVGMLSNANNVPAATSNSVSTTVSARASIAGRGRRQSEAPQRKRSSVALRRLTWTLKYHDFVPDTLDFHATRGFGSSKPEKFKWVYAAVSIHFRLELFGVSYIAQQRVCRQTSDTNGSDLSHHESWYWLPPHSSSNLYFPSRRSSLQVYKVYGTKYIGYQNLWHPTHTAVKYV